MRTEHSFELYLLTDEATAAQWQALYGAVSRHTRALGSFAVTLHCSDNVVRWFVRSGEDLSALSGGLDQMVLRPVAVSELALPRATKRENFLQLPKSGNLLNLREYCLIKKGKTLEYAEVRVGAFGLTTVSLFFKDRAGQWSVLRRRLKQPPAHLFAINFATNTGYLKKQAPTYLDIEKSLGMLRSDPAGAVFTVDTFPYFARPYYLGLGDYQFDKHSFIIGSSGSGKSKLIELLIDRLRGTLSAMDYRVVVIDPHASLEHDLRHPPSTKVINFSGETAQLFPRGGADISAATELTTALLLSLMATQTPSSRLERVLRFSLYVLFTAQCMSLPMLKSFLTELDTRSELLQHVRGYVPDNLIMFFGSEFNEIRTQHYTEAVAPIVSLVDEMQLQPSLLGEADMSLLKTIQDNFLSVFSLNKVSMGEKVVKTVAGLLIQQIFLLAQARAFGQKVILIVDEVSVVQNPALASILAEARKFNLTVILSQQYFGQIEAGLRNAIFSNVLNYYIFRVSEEDARALQANITMELPKAVVEAAASRRLSEADLRTRLMTELHPRECLVRVVSGGQIVPAVRARTMDTSPRAPAAPAQLATYQQQQLPTAFIKRST